ncbi:MAG TPA: RsfS/YbeB/iojap family protein [Candidatus Azoamicus sp. OHIO2]
MLNTVYNYLAKNKLYDIKVFNTDVLDVDFIIIVTVISQKQINEIGMKLLKFVRNKYKLTCLSLCGVNTGWLVVDLNLIVVHIMLHDIQSLYKLEELYIRYS